MHNSITILCSCACFILEPFERKVQTFQFFRPVSKAQRSLKIKLAEKSPDLEEEKIIPLKPNCFKKVLGIGAIK